MNTWTIVEIVIGIWLTGALIVWAWQLFDIPELDEDENNYE